jgi:hypothetical protein
VRCSEATLKLIDRSEETEDDGTMILHERERFANELTIAKGYALEILRRG